MTEAVDHPSHYNTGKIEVIDAIEDWKLGFHEGNVVKYVARARHKGCELEDLRKARWYLDRKIKDLEPKTKMAETPEELAAAEREQRAKTAADRRAGGPSEAQLQWERDKRAGTLDDPVGDAT